MQKKPVNVTALVDSVDVVPSLAQEGLLQSPEQSRLF